MPVIETVLSDVTVHEGVHAHTCHWCKVDIAWVDDSVCGVGEDHDHEFCSWAHQTRWLRALDEERGFRS